MKHVTSLALVIMTVVSLMSVFGLQLAGLSVLIGVIFYVVVNTKQQTKSFNALDLKAAYKELTKISVCLWALLPLSINVVVFFLAKFFLPGFLDQVAVRTAQVVSIGGGLLLIIQLILAALGEEIAWRAFFQSELGKVLSIRSSIIITSIFFAIAHFSLGNLTITIIDVLLVFVNSVFYGLIFAKTKNALVSSLAHFAANLVAILLLMVG